MNLPTLLRLSQYAKADASLIPAHIEQGVALEIYNQYGRGEQ